MAEFINSMADVEDKTVSDDEDSERYGRGR